LARVTVDKNKSTGVSVHIESADPEVEARVRQTLGLFPFAISITTTTRPTSER